MSTVYADLDDIVFEHREKDYGSYEMRKRSQQYLGRAALIAFLIFMITVGAIFFPPHLFSQEDEFVAMDSSDFVLTETVELDIPEEEEIEEEPEEEIIKINEIKSSTIKFEIPEPKPDEEVPEDSTITEIEKFDSIPPGEKTQEGDTVGFTSYDFDELGGDDDLSDIEDKPKGGNDAPGPNDFVNFEKEPAPVNLDDIKKLIGYPPMAKEAEIEGRVMVRILVDENGNYMKHVVLKNPHPLLTGAVEKQLKSLKFTPGIQGGRPIKLWVTIPFKFELGR